MVFPRRPVVIRRGCTADLDAVERLNRKLQDYERRLRSSRRPGRTLPRAYVQALLRKDKTNTGRLFVATSATRVIGFLACALESDVFEIDALRILISDLVVATPWRRRGVAAALIAAAEDFARERGVQWIEISTLVRNTAARRAYAALGFRESAVTFERRLAASAT